MASLFADASSVDDLDKQWEWKIFMRAELEEEVSEETISKDKSNFEDTC